MVKVKICGVKDKAIAACCIEEKVDYIGLVFFAKSPRYIELEKAVELADFIRSQGKKNHPHIVALTVNSDDIFLQKMHDMLRPDYIQCHGNETIERLQDIATLTKTKLIKAFPIQQEQDIAIAKDFYAAFAHFLPLFDTKPPKNALLPGGNGAIFDWTLLQNWDHTIPYILSGGLNAENVQQAMNTSQAPIIDISSGVESEKGVKSAKMIKEFVKQVRCHDNITTKIK